MEIRLTKEEFDCTVSAEFISESFRKEMVDGVQKHYRDGEGRESVIVELTEDIADEIRSLCEDQLNAAGFDVNYALNSEGKILDSLIEKLFIG